MTGGLWRVTGQQVASAAEGTAPADGEEVRGPHASLAVRLQVPCCTVPTGQGRTGSKVLPSRSQQPGEGNVMNAAQLQGLQSDALRMSTMREGLPSAIFQGAQGKWSSLQGSIRAVLPCCRLLHQQTLMFERQEEEFVLMEPPAPSKWWCSVKGPHSSADNAEFYCASSTRPPPPPPPPRPPPPPS